MYQVNKEDRERTTLTAELERMGGVMEARLLNYRPPKGTVVETIVQIFKKHSRMLISESEMVQIKKAVSEAVEKEEPVKLAFLWAFSGMARSSIKFLQPEINYPRLGDIWAYFWIKILDEKIKKVHPPGIKVLIVDEKPLLLIIGWDEKPLNQRFRVMKKLAEEVAPEVIEVTQMPSFDDVARSLTVSPPSNDEILSIVTSVKEYEEKIGMDVLVEFLYKTREKPWDEIQMLIPELIWRDALERRMEMIRIGAARKKTGYLSQCFSGASYIDACIVEKGRFCPDIWAMTFPQHGGTVLNASEKGRFSVKCLPENRLKGDNCLPVLINTKEFDEIINSDSTNGQDYIFYWLEK